MATINIGGSTVEVPDSLNLADPPTAQPTQLRQAAPPPSNALVPIEGTGTNGYRPNFTMGEPPPARPTVWQSLRGAFDTAGDAINKVRGVGAGIGDAGAAVGRGLQEAGENAGATLKNAGAAVGKASAGVAGQALRKGAYGADVIPHAAAYTDGSIPFTDKVKLGLQDATRMVGAAGGAAFGSGAGSVVPVAGTIAGGVAGAVGGDWAAHKAANAVFGGDDILRRHGYDPNRSIINMAGDAMAGKDAREVFGAPPPRPGSQEALMKGYVTRMSPDQYDARAGTSGELPQMVVGRGAGDHQQGPTRASTQPITFAPTDGPEQPSGARTNVLRIGNSYSGPEGVGGNISINNVGHRGTVNMLGGQPGDATPAERLAQIERDTLHAREMNGLRAQLMDRGAPPPGVTMFSGETLGSALRKQSDAQGSLSTINNSDIGAKDRALLAQNERNQNLQAATTRRGQDMLADTTRHGQNLTYAGQTRGQDIVASTALRGQDMDLQGRILPKQMETQMAQQMRRIHGDLMKASGGDYGKAAQLASAYGLGDHAKNFMELGQAEQKFGSEKLNAVRDMFKGQFASPDKDGKLVRDELLESQAAAMALAANPNFASMPQDQRNELVGNIGRQVKQLQSANAKNGDIWSWMKLKNAPSAYTSMPSPEELRGATYGDAGWGAILPGGANRLDRQLRLKDGREFNIDPSLVTQGDIALWEKYGAKPR